uniref:Lysophospholipid acyltransferase 7 n=1 Tax=Chromera velia CCMP2878 TaxID=1169474 RepID=A0A0G4HI59_9ALVE|eukprot:Cvel_27722.t1-p1 / transcript=Cvel_27722.t1 / gene=Cvel_27722 / organism=Chromera_velia_CCMP2878 / gene_product=Lysophospholipid acyltransferase 7, putative / transcript_product=Lysophospholipid acyltransferase 7, putative / location=Cvel_scaffold3506:866-3946(-) / protein_length=463 / sequence_SO=supercontig / SO=protein_coding / is_pseudo=false
MGIPGAFIVAWLQSVPAELMFTFFLITGLLQSFLVPHVPKGGPRCWYSSVNGLMTVVAMSTDAMHHWVAVTVLSWLTIQATVKTPYCGRLVFVLSFGYQMVMRYLDYTGRVPLSDTASMTMLMHPLKLVEVAFLCQDQGKPVSVADFMNYLLFFPASWSGPFVNYKDVHTALHSEVTVKAKSLTYTVTRTMETLPMLALYFLRNIYFDVDEMLKDEFLLKPLWYRMGFCIISTVAFRSRLIIAWLVAECSVAATGLGYDPNNDTIDRELFRAYDIAVSEMGTEMKQNVRGWNCSVQKWMATYPYKRIPGKWPKLLKRVFAMTTSAVWHGLSPGYFLTFSVFPFFQEAQEAVWKLKWPLSDNKAVNDFVYDPFKRLVTAFMMAFVGLPFVFREWDPVLKSLRAVSWSGMYVLASWVVLAGAVGVMKKKGKRKKRVEGEGATKAAGEGGQEGGTPKKDEGRVKAE